MPRAQADACWSWLFARQPGSRAAGQPGAEAAARVRSYEFGATAGRSM
ncbi:hypothetical protein PYK79_37565 [Streptomyces sp. ID05-04B]|nr:hypothetical protein [Streptomyces sp. ID05-04B]MDX5567819.1 hypothetical protein [Streptomyces sp. ID05-04B]